MKMENLSDRVKHYWQVEKREGDWKYLYWFDLYEIKQRGFFTPVKPIIQWLGCDWSMVRKDIMQHRKELKPALIKALSADGKNRLMICLPVPKLMDYLDRVNRTHWDHRDIFKREEYRLSDVQPGDMERNKGRRKLRAKDGKGIHER